MRKLFFVPIAFMVMYACSEPQGPPPNLLPNASCGYASYSGYDTVSVTFTNTSTNADSYLWDFGDGNTSTLSAPTHIFNGAGVYQVKLVAYNQHGSDTVVLPITIYPTPTTMIVNQLVLQSITAGVGQWDPQIPFSDNYGYPDIEASIFSAPGVLYTSFGSTNHINASPSNVPYYFTDQFTVTNLNDSLKIYFYDDDVFDPDVLMGYAVIPVAEHVGTWPGSIDVITNTPSSMSATLYVSWQ
jgi:PKD repeat protein